MLDNEKLSLANPGERDRLQSNQIDFRLICDVLILLQILATLNRKYCYAAIHERSLASLHLYSFNNKTRPERASQTYSIWQTIGLTQIKGFKN